MKTTHVIIIAIVAFAMIACAGCTSSTSTSTATKHTTYGDNVYVSSSDDTRNKYDWIVVSGKIYNGNDIDVAVFGHVDFYDKNNVKFDSAPFSAKPDAHGFATFDATSTDAEDYSSGVTYVIEIEHIYKN